MSPYELAALQPVADQLAAAGTWTRADFDEADSDWQAPLATACNYFPRLLAEVLRLRAGLEGLRRDHEPHTEEVDDGGGYFDTMWIPCPCGVDEHNAQIDALLASTP